MTQGAAAGAAVEPLEDEQVLGQSPPRAVRIDSLAIFALAFAVYLAGSWIRPMWLDEAATLTALRRPFGDLFAIAFNRDVSVLPYYVVLWPFRLVSDSALWLRLPSIAAMALAAVVVYSLCKRLGGTALGIVTALLFIALPATSRYAQEMRPYAFACLAVTAATWLLIYASESSRKRWWLAYALALVLVGLMNAFALLIIVAHVVWVLSQPRVRRQALWPVGCIAVAGIALLPYLALVKQHAHGVGAAPKITLGNLLLLLDFPGRGGVAQPDHLHFGPVFAACLLVLAAIGAVAAIRTPSLRAPMILGLAWGALCPIVLLSLQVFAGEPTMVLRYYTVWLPGVCLAAAVGICALWRVWAPSVVLIGLLLAVLALPAQLQVRSYTAVRQDGRATVAAIDVPSISQYPLFPIARWGSYVLTVARLGEQERARMPKYGNTFASGTLEPDLVSQDQLRASLVNTPAVVAMHLKSGPLPTAEVKKLGFTQLWVSCQGTQTHELIKVMVRPSQAPRVAPAQTISAQMRAAAWGLLRCTP